MKKKVAIIILMIIMAKTNSQEMPGRVKENTLRAVIKIEIPIKKKGKQPNGTGFLVSKPSDKTQERQFFLVTNKHVVGDWNIADGNIVNYFEEIDIFLYTKGAVSGNLYGKQRILIKDSIGNVSNKLKLHHIPKVDIAIIDVTDEIKNIKDIALFSFDITFLSPFDKIYSGMHYGIGDQVYALGYPLGITSTKSNLPIAKSGYLASLPGEEFQVEINCLNRAKLNVQTSAEGKLLIVDGLIVGGNSGGPLVVPAEIRFRPSENAKNGYEVSTEFNQNLILGIVSMGLGTSGISIIYSSDYIIELINKF